MLIYIPMHFSPSLRELFQEAQVAAATLLTSVCGRNMIMVRDGYCAYTCAVFMQLMKESLRQEYRQGRQVANRPNAGYRRCQRIPIISVRPAISVHHGYIKCHS